MTVRPRLIVCMAGLYTCMLYDKSVGKLGDGWLVANDENR